MEKVKISKGEEEYYTKYCPRCDKYYCLDCIDFYLVEEDIIEKDMIDGVSSEYRWKGEEVCPWCFNQLVDIFNESENKDKVIDDERC